MHRTTCALAVLICACEPGESTDITDSSAENTASVEQGLRSASASASIGRERVTGDVFHYEFVVPVGDGPNAALHIHRVVRERAPFRPRRSTGAVMMLHGDFATFATNFAPILGDPASSATGVATWLARRGIDVWGLDRRWARAPEEGADVSDFEDMGIEQELADIGTALAFARAIRLVTDASIDRMTLVGFSRGGELAYFYASDEATRPVRQRHVKALVPLDVYVSLSPEDEDLRQFFCEAAAFEYDVLAAGEVDSPNGFQIHVGRQALAAPDDPTDIEFYAGLTNREAMLAFVGQTYVLFPASPLYHLNAPVLADGQVTGLRESSEDVVAHWLAGSAPHQSMREAADTDALTCGEDPLPVDVPLSRIRVPLLLLAAAGGYGAHALFSTTQVGSSDVTALVIRRLPEEREAEDFGHADLLFASDAAALAWQPLLEWLREH